VSGERRAFGKSLHPEKTAADHADLRTSNSKVFHFDNRAGNKMQMRLLKAFIFDSRLSVQCAAD
jgi:hypothetical protein